MIPKGPFTLVATLALIAVVIYTFNFSMTQFYNVYKQVDSAAASEVDARAQQVAPTLQLIVNAVAAVAILVAALSGYKQIRSQA